MSNDALSTALSLFKVNRLLMLTLIFMALGTVSELILIDHYEDAWQLVPIILIGLSVLLFILLKLKPSPIVSVLFKGAMLLCVLSGLIGTGLHLNANIEFEAELHSSASGWSIFTNSLSGALPTLAPGSMIVFGLIGYSHTLLTLKQQQ